MKQKVRKWVEQMAQEWFEVPSGTLNAQSRVVILAMNQVVIENFDDLMTFSPEHVQIRVRDGMIAITGRNLFIRSVVPEELIVEGKIVQVHFSPGS